MTPSGLAAEPIRYSKSERAYDAVRRRIEDGSYGPGLRLVLARIARELQVSTVPVREALRRLEAEGYVVYERNVGARVATVDTDQYAYSMEVLAYLEGAATALAAPRLAAGQLARARDINTRLAAGLDAFDPLAFTRLNQEFHLILCGVASGACPNPHLRALIEREWRRLDLIRRTTFSFVPARARRSVEEHDALLELVAGGAPAERIERRARTHKLATMTALVEHTAITRLLARRPPLSVIMQKRKKPSLTFLHDHGRRGGMITGEEGERNPGDEHHT